MAELSAADKEWIRKEIEFRWEEYMKKWIMDRIDEAETRTDELGLKWEKRMKDWVVEDIAQKTAGLREKVSSISEKVRTLH